VIRRVTLGDSGLTVGWVSQEYGGGSAASSMVESRAEAQDKLLKNTGRE